MRKILVLCATALIAIASIRAEDLPDLCRPLDIPLLLSGNFGELRSDHFHSGIDIKTQGRTGLTVHCVDDGYVSRVAVSPWGFGRAIYVDHPQTGLTSVYGHLDSFSNKIDSIVRDEQYKRESFQVDLEFEPNEIPVKKGEVIAKSGNSGSSGGPHLHLDIRDTKTEEPLDPMPYFKQYITDKVAPEVRSVALYPVPGKGTACNGSIGVYQSGASLSISFVAWGKVIPAIKAYDKMSGTTNIYGVKYLTFSVDGKVIYKRTIDRFSFDNTRALNTLVSYADWIKSKSWMMITYVPPTRPLGEMIETDDSNGVLDIDEERDYQCEFKLADEYGNTSVAKFVIKGKRMDLPTEKKNGTLFHCNGNNSYNSEDGLKVSFPKGTFYDDIYFSASSEPSSEYKSAIHSVGNTLIPIATSFDMVIDVTNDDISDKSKYCVVKLSGKKPSAVTSTYDNGKMKARVSSFGRYAVTTDFVAPTITPINPNSWGKSGRVVYKISDDLSGIKTYRGEIDGRYALFEYDGKTGTLSFKMDGTRFDKGKTHNVVMTVTDACGNKAESHQTFTW